MCGPQEHETVAMSVQQKPPVPECENMKKIAEDMDTLHGVHSSTRRTTTEYLMFSLIGFGTIERRDAFMRVVQWTLEPLLLYSSFIKDVGAKEFEAIVITKKQVTIESVEEWFELFNMGLCCIQFDSYMQPDMVTCISRIHHLGKHWFGTFKSKTAARVRRDYYTQYGKEMRAKELQRVLDVTGMTVTPRNMLVLHDRITTLQSQISNLERRLQDANGSSSEATQNREVTIITRNNLASAYRRLQASGDLPAAARIPRIPPIEIPPPQQPASPPMTPSEAHAPPVAPHATAFVARPPPMGTVTVYVVRE